MTESSYGYAYHVLRTEYAHLHGVQELTASRPPAKVVERWKEKLRAVGVLDRVEAVVRDDVGRARERPHARDGMELETVMRELQNAPAEETPWSFAPFTTPDWEDLSADELAALDALTGRLQHLTSERVARAEHTYFLGALTERFGVAGREALAAAVSTGASVEHVHARIILAERPGASLRQILRVFRDAEPALRSLIASCVGLRTSEAYLASSALREQLRGFPRERLIHAAGSEEELDRIERGDVLDEELRDMLVRVRSGAPMRSAALLPDLPATAASGDERRRAFEEAGGAIRFRAAAGPARLSHLPGSGRAVSAIAALLEARESAGDDKLRMPFLFQGADALFADVDGTLIDTYDARHGLALRRLRLLASEGVPIALCTGRDSADVARILQHPAAFPRVRIYGRNGMDVIESDGVAWRRLAPIVEPSAIHAPERVAAYEALAGALARLDAPCVETVKRRDAFLTLSLTTAYRAVAHELATPPEAIDGLVATLGAALELPEGFRLWNCGEALQIIPAELGKRACLEHFAATRGIDAERILRAGDQGQAGAPHLVSGNDAEILAHPLGVSVLHPSSSGARTPQARGAGLAWILDNASFRLSTTPTPMLDASAFGIAPAQSLSGYSLDAPTLDPRERDAAESDEVALLEMFGTGETVH